ncbi:hypothetical protein AC629_32860 [Bradyrhizobium sp. NAS80.1]|uniref:hypothetical protein n=1 Tax=Bradyrhizobium sp. NAS80.1 TaxID=1680159 RepID=UPI0009593233|nr:hypothetical protein [Bradyrhizobium sp. NAS80.1]OKO76425.1 hypothetical protein AC629_32860 [Bradyrhizobium sp. NAS80.1]
MQLAIGAPQGENLPLNQRDDASSRRRSIPIRASSYDNSPVAATIGKIAARWLLDVLDLPRGP